MENWANSAICCAQFPTLFTAPLSQIAFNMLCEAAHSQSDVIEIRFSHRGHFRYACSDVPAFFFVDGQRASRATYGHRAGELVISMQYAHVCTAKWHHTVAIDSVCAVTLSIQLYRPSFNVRLVVLHVLLDKHNKRVKCRKLPLASLVV